MQVAIKPLLEEPIAMYKYLGTYV